MLCAGGFGWHQQVGKVSWLPFLRALHKECCKGFDPSHVGEIERHPPIPLLRNLMAQVLNRDDGPHGAEEPKEYFPFPPYTVRQDYTQMFKAYPLLRTVFKDLVSWSGVDC